jgi:Mg/Co/Ni transporter MgtE
LIQQGVDRYLRRGAAEDRLAVFLRGLLVGALVGAILAGAALARRPRSR